MVLLRSSPPSKKANALVLTPSGRRQVEDALAELGDKPAPSWIWSLPAYSSLTPEQGGPGGVSVGNAFCPLDYGGEANDSEESLESPPSKKLKTDSKPESAAPDEAPESAAPESEVPQSAAKSATPESAAPTARE